MTTIRRCQHCIIICAENRSTLGETICFFTHFDLLEGRVERRLTAFDSEFQVELNLIPVLPLQNKKDPYV